MITITHLITSLERGGAEWMLTKLVDQLPRDRFRCKVISLMREGPLGDVLRARGIEVMSLGMIRGRLSPSGMVRLARQLIKDSPDVLQTWLYHADLAGLAAVLLPHAPRLVWNIRCSNLDMDDYSLSSAIVRHLLARGSRVPKYIVFNSHAGMEAHLALGYRPRASSILPNGFDLDTCRPDPTARQRVRAELGLPEDAVVVGNVARYDPMKDHRNFLRAAAIVSDGAPGTHFVAVGAGTDSPDLADQIRRNELGGQVHCLGVHPAPASIIAGLDILVSASAYGEGFPNVIGEAMACGVPCIATATGDCHRIIAGTGLVVPTRNPAALAEAMLTMVAAGHEARSRLGAQARRRIAEHYSLDSITARYAALYETLVSQSR